jgi:hypothetical protein
VSAKRRDIILTGLPRSGTTLTCHLLNQLPDTLALHEPMNVDFPREATHEEVCDEVGRFFRDTRSRALSSRTVQTKHIEGRLPVNPISDHYAAEGLRPALATRGEVRIDKDLGADFLLVIKHPAAFTALLETLLGRYPCYAVMRNPLSVLVSWNTIAVPVQQGHAPAAERLDAELTRALAGIEDRIGRQLHLLSWFYEKYDRLLPRESILRYEDTVATGGVSLSAITPLAARLTESLESKNANKVYDDALMRTLGERLLGADGAFWKFYSRESVELLLRSLPPPR